MKVDLTNKAIALVNCYSTILKGLNIEETLIVLGVAQVSWVMGMKDTIEEERQHNES